MKMNYILHLLLGLSATVFSAFDRSVCPAQVRSYKYLHLFADQCILFVSTTKSWDSARSYCKSLHGDLVTIKNADKQKYILDSLRIDHWNQDQIWIGATDKDHEGQWRWVDGSKVSYQRFADGQGNNHNGGFFLAGGSNEDCAMIRRGDSGNWHDYPCSPPSFGIGYKYSFACEFHASLPGITPQIVSTAITSRRVSPLQQTTQTVSQSPETHVVSTVPRTSISSTFKSTKKATVLTKIARPGDNVTFTCPIKTEGSGVIEWYGPPNASILYSSGSTLNPRLTSIAIIGDHSLGEYNIMIMSITKFDSGRYRCSWGEGGVVTSAMFSLHV